MRIGNTVSYLGSVILVAAAAIVSPAPANAQAVAQDRQARSGVQQRIGGGWNCGTPTQLPIITVTREPANGTVSTSQLASGSPCGNGPVVAVFYQSRPGFKGTDEVTYSVQQTGTRFPQVIAVRVKVQ